MQKGNPQISAIALLVLKYGEQLENGGYEVHVTKAEMTSMSPHGVFQEVPDTDGMGVRWQYFPNRVLNIEGHTVPDELESLALVHKAKYTREQVAAMNVSEEEAQRLLRENAND